MMTLRALSVILALGALLSACAAEPPPPEPAPACAIEDPKKDGGIGGTGQAPPPCPEG